MLILGTKYSITDKERELLLAKVSKIHTIDIKNTADDEVIEQIKSHIKNNQVEFLVLNLDKKASMHMKGFLEEVEHSGIKILLFSQFVAKFFNRCHINFNKKNFDAYNSIYHNEFHLFAKRLFDIVFSMVVLFLLSPIFLVIALLIKIKSPNGPIFFGHQRIGKDGRFFRVYKFRTMVPDAEAKLAKMLDDNPKAKAEFANDFKLKDDPRIISGIGGFLRKSSLDELPQFFNSLIGNMSVVGPRPIVEDEIHKYGEYVVKLYSVKPGVTGLWQVSGRNDIDYDKRVKLDMEYIDTQTLLLDMKIIFKTIIVMIFKKGAY